MTSKRFNKIIVWLLSVFLLVSLALPTTSYAGSSLMLIVGDTQVFDEYGYESDVVYFWEEADSGDNTYSQTADEENYLFSVVYSSDDGFVLTMNDMEILSYLVIDDRACGIGVSGAELNIVLNGTVIIGSDEDRPYYGIFSEYAVSLASPGGNGEIFINALVYGIQTFNDLYIREGQVTVDVDEYEEDPSMDTFGFSSYGKIVVEGGEINITKRGQIGDAVYSNEDIRIFGNAVMSIVDWSNGHGKCGLHSDGTISIGANAQVDICSQSISIRATDSIYIGYEWDNGASEYIASGSPTVTVNDALSIAAAESTSSGGAEFIAGESFNAQEVHLSGGRVKATGSASIDSNSITLPDGAYVYKSSTEAGDPGGSWNYDNYDYSDEHNFIDIAFIHTITYHLNGGENHEDNADHYIFGETLTLEEPSKANHTFNGWYEQPDFSGSPVVAISPTDTGDKTLYANWTEQLPISTALIEGVTAPVRGAAPVTAVTETAQYTGTIAWSPSDNPFAAGTVYTATITLAPKEGYVLTGVTPNFFTVDGATTVTNEADSGVITAVFPATTAARSSGGGSSTPSYKADVKAGGNNMTTLPVTVNTALGTASVDTGSQELSSGGTTVMIPSVPHAQTYAVGIPVPNLSTADKQGRLTVETDRGSITVASDMLTGVEDINGSKAEISISSGDKDSLPEDVKSALGDRPIVRLSLSIDGQQTGWNNPDSPVTVTIPYAPSPEELKHPEGIVVWYIDGSGNPQCVTNGRYDPTTGTVTFDTTHFSDYAVAYNPVSFSDVAANAWYSKAVSFIAARDITTGTGNGNYSPDAKLTRGDFLALMMRALDIAPDTNPADNFSDAGDTYYTGYLAAAKRLGISSGIGNNMGRVGEQHPEDATNLYAPEKEITRQEMFTLLYNALKATNQLPRMHGRATAAGSDQPGMHGRATAAGSDQPEGNSGKTISDFSDVGQISSWAKDAMTLLVETGMVSGSNGAILPLATTTRAEMAQVLYNLLVK